MVRRVLVLMSWVLVFASSSVRADEKSPACKVTAYLRSGLLSLAWTPGKKLPVKDLQECIDRARDEAREHGERLAWASFKYEDAELSLSGRIKNKD